MLTNKFHQVFIIIGQLPVAPSALKPAGHVSLVRPKKDYETPRALEIDDTLACMLTDAQNAMTALRKRKVRWGKWDMLDAEVSLVVEALDASEAIVDASSPLQMHLAALEVRRSILANIAAKKAQNQ